MPLSWLNRYLENLIKYLYLFLMMIIAKEFTFDSAHKLSWHNRKCKNLHGHTYRLQVRVKRNLNKKGIVLDFGDMKEIIKIDIIEKLDHRYLNDIIKNPTVENMCLWIWKRLKPKIKGLYEVRLWETPSSFAIYNGK